MRRCSNCRANGVRVGRDGGAYLRSGCTRVRCSAGPIFWFWMFPVPIATRFVWVEGGDAEMSSRASRLEKHSGLRTTGIVLMRWRISGFVLWCESFVRTTGPLCAFRLGPGRNIWIRDIPSGDLVGGSFLFSGAGKDSMWMWAGHADGEVWSPKEKNRRCWWARTVETSEVKQSALRGMLRVSRCP